MKITKSITLKISLLILMLSSMAMGQQPELVSVNRLGTGSGNNQSYYPIISANGRYVVFGSQANNLVSNDNNGSIRDIFVRDLVSDKTALVSVNKAGTGGGNASSSNLAFSADGRYVIFTSEASDLVANDTNSYSDVFVRDLAAGTTSLLSVNRAGTGSGNGHSWNTGSRVATISADGRYVVFQSYASDLVAHDTNSWTDVFIRDLVTNTTKLVSVKSTGVGSGNSASFPSVISANGRFVAFASGANDLVDNDFNEAGVMDVFLRDVVAGTTELVSVNRLGTGSGDSDSDFRGPPTMTPDGRFVAFDSYASDLVDNDYNDMADVYVRDVVADTTELVSVNHAGTMSGNSYSIPFGISNNGKRVAFTSNASDLVGDDNNKFDDVFVRDLGADKTTLVSVNSVGNASGNRRSGGSFISPNGRYVVFNSFATNIADNDVNGLLSDVFIRDLTTRTTTLLSVNKDGTGSGKGPSGAAIMSANNLTVVFESRAADLARNDRSTNLDIFAVSLKAGSIQFGAPVYSFGENSGTATIDVKRTGSSRGAVSVDYATSDGSAAAGQDYTAVSGTLNFANGETVKTITIPISDDSVDEPGETVNLKLSHPTGGVLLGARSRAVLDIVDDE